jgi:hypothetical protein
MAMEQTNRKNFHFDLISYTFMASEKRAKIALFGTNGIFPQEMATPDAKIPADFEKPAGIIGPNCKSGATDRYG